MSRKISATNCLSELKTKERLLSSIHKISSLLTRPISLDKILTCIVQETAQVFGFIRAGHLSHRQGPGPVGMQVLDRLQ